MRRILGQFSIVVQHLCQSELSNSLLCVVFLFARGNRRLFFSFFPTDIVRPLGS